MPKTGILVWAAVALVALTKAADCVSTQLYVRNAHTETNPVGKALMHKLGFTTAIWTIFSFVVVWVAAQAAAVLSGSWVVSAWFVLLSLWVSVMQLAVAWTNSTGRWNVLTRWVLRMHMRALARR